MPARWLFGSTTGFQCMRRMCRCLSVYCVPGRSGESFWPVPAGTFRSCVLDRSD